VKILTKYVPAYHSAFTVLNLNLKPHNQTMKEIKDIVSAFHKAVANGKKTALATVVSVEGSSYRRPGARMLITEDGELTGAISGGCLEGDALRKALYVMSEQRAMVVTYDTMDEDDAGIGVGLGCNGIVRILIEPVIESDRHHPLALLEKLLQQRELAVIVTVFSFNKSVTQQPGTCLLYLSKALVASTEKNIIPGNFETEVEEAFSSGLSLSFDYDHEGYRYTALVELIKPSVSLVIFGAGNDAIPLTQISAILGWHTTVIDGRRNYATAQRFPNVQQLLVAKPASALSQITVDQQTVFILMTHNYNYDFAIFRQLITRTLSYIGVLGPRKRLERMLQELKEEGVEMNDRQLANVFGPVGLDIGAEAAEEIALSVVAEINAVMNKKTGSSLRTKEGSIHAPFHSIKSANG
jgi:xanthine dehydrogenase accessory factor